MARSVFWAAFAIVASAGVLACSAQNDEAVPNNDVGAGDMPGATEQPPATNTPAPPSGGEMPKPPDVNLPNPNTPPPGPKERTIIAIDDASTLLTFLAKDPRNVTTKAITGLAQGESILGIDIRPSNGMLYALGSTSRIYTIDRATGAATALGNAALTPSLQGQSFGFDFNPVADAIRIHSDFNQNLRVSPMTGAVVMADKPLAFAEGDANYLQDPNIVATAYTNSVAPKPTATDLYAIDSTRDILVKVAPPNDGKVTTVGSLGVNLVSAAGFDIYGTGDKTEAYAALHAEGDKMPSLFKIDLATGRATKIADIGHAKPVQGIAIEP